MTIFETRTTLQPALVIERARSFFTDPATSWGASAEAVGERCLRVHFDMGEIVIGAIAQDGVTTIRGSASRGAHLVTRFLASLRRPGEMKQTTRRYGFQETHAVLSHSFVGGGSEPVPALEPSDQATMQAA